MPQVELPPDLFEKVEHSLPTGGSVNEFVRDAVVRKLDDEERRKEFHRLSSKVREAMIAQGITEEEILADFERHRRSQSLPST